MAFQNINSRATVRILDFSPPNLADFAVRRHKISEYEILSEPESSISSGGESDGSDSPAASDSETEERPWEWRFALVLEDASDPRMVENAKMEVFVAGQDAECLLKLDAEE